MTLGDRIKKIRERTGMSQVDFADKIDVSKQTLYKYENNIITNVPSDKIERIAEVGNVSPAYLMGWEREEVKGDEMRLQFYYDAMCRPELQKLIEAAYNSSEENIELVTNMLKKMK